MSYPQATCKNKKHEALVPEIDRVIRDMKTSGELALLIAKAER